MKTIYSEDKKEYYLQETTKTVFSFFETQSEREYVENPFPVKPIEGMVYTVIFDDEEYYCKAYKDGEYVHIGDSMLNSEAMPFDIYETQTEIWAGALHPGFHRIIIEQHSRSELPGYILTTDVLVESFEEIFGQTVNGVDFVYVSEHKKEGTKHILTRNYYPKNEAFKVAFKATDNYNTGDMIVIGDQEYKFKFRENASSRVTDLPDGYFISGDNAGIAIVSSGWLIFDESMSLKNTNALNI